MVFSKVKQGDLFALVKYQLLTLISHVVYYELWNLEIVILQPIKQSIYKACPQKQRTHRLVCLCI